MVLHFQRNGDTRALISNNPDVKINKLSDSIRKLYPNNFSFIAKTWFTFSLLTERSQELTNIELRGMYPEYAIGKLEAAELDFESSTTVPAIGKQRKNRYQYRFSLKRESSNVKFKENDMVLIFPFSLRDSISAKQKYSWMFTIDRFELNSLTNTYFITTKPAIHNLTLKLQKEGIEKPRWFMYPFVMANWSSKLYKSKDSSNSLLQKNNLGYSWLADRISILWQLTEQSELELPEKLFFPSSHIYLFTPDLLNKINYNYENTTLLTNVFPKPDESQKNSILYALSGPLRLIQGPPGTGKSQTIVAIIDEFIQRSKYDKDKIRILVTAFSYPAIEVIVKKIADSKNEYGSPTDVASAQKLYISSDSRNPLVLDGDEMTYLIDNLQKKEGEKWLFNSTTELPNKTKSNSEEEKLEDKLEDTTIFFANAHQLYHMSKTKKGKPILSYNKIEFDLIILDEASQLPADYLTSILQTVINKEIELKFSKQINNETVTPDDLEHIIIVNPNDLKTHVVLVGDNNQLPPVQPIKPPKALKNILGSVFDYYREGFKLDMRQLLYNYRSHFLIIEHTNSLNIYDSLKPAPNSNNKNKLIEGNIDAINKGWTKEVLDPKKVLVALIHNYEYDTGLSRTEATVTVRLIIDYFRMLNPQTEDQQRKFWQNEIGIVAPHNAHGRYIINEISRELNDLNLNKLTGFELSSLLRNTIFSVEKFQGSERSMIIATIGVSAKDQLDKEEEFIYDRNRLNVLTTRAKYKMVLICSENFLNHVPNDLDRSFDVNMSKNFAYTFCDQNSSFKVDVGDKEQTIEFYYKEA